MDYNRIVLLGGFLALLVGVGFAAFKTGQKHPILDPNTGVKVDSVVVIQYDTITREKPVYLTKYIDRIQLVPVRDTIRLKDTLFVAMERERVEWKDEYAQVFASGIDPSVDSVRHFLKTKIVTEKIVVPQRAKRIGWAVAAGPGVFWQPGMNNVAPGIGVVVGLRINIER